MNSVCALFFDIDNTLVDRNRAFARLLDQTLARPPFVSLCATDRIALKKDLLTLDNRGLCEREFFCRQSSARIYTDFRIKLSPAEIWALHGDIPALIKPSAGIYNLLKTLQTKYRLFIISNGDGPRQRRKLSRARLVPFFEDIFISGEIGAAKPAPLIFGQALLKSALPPGRCLMIGDDPERDIKGAAGVGMHTLHIRSVDNLPGALRNYLRY